MAARLDSKELTPELRKQLGIKLPRKPRSMTANDVRTAAIRVLGVVADLTPAERSRVLRHAAKLNEV